MAENYLLFRPFVVVTPKERASRFDQEALARLLAAITYRNRDVVIGQLASGDTLECAFGQFVCEFLLINDGSARVGPDAVSSLTRSSKGNRLTDFCSMSVPAP